MRNMTSTLLYRLLILLILFLSIQSTVSFEVTLQDDDCIMMTLEPSDLRDNITAYAARISGEPHNHILPFHSSGDGQLAPVILLYNTTYHGLCYTISLLLADGSTWTKPVKTVTLLTKPLPLQSVQISDYQPDPETGVVFELRWPERNSFSRVNISYSEGREQRFMLYKDFQKGKTVFKHWLPGTCYSNITFQLISEATVNKSTLIEKSDVIHEPHHHRTVPTPPLNVSLKIIPLNRRGLPATNWGEKTTQDTRLPRKARNVSQMEVALETEVRGKEEDPRPKEKSQMVTQPPLSTSESLNSSSAPFVNVVNDVYTPTAEIMPTNTSDVSESENSTASYWPMGRPSPTEGEYEFVNGVAPEYEDSKELGSAMDLRPESIDGSNKPPSILLELRWLPPPPPTTIDGFNVYIYRDGNKSETTTVEENTHEFFTELSEPGTYRVQVTTISSSGECEPRESASLRGFTFYLSPTGEWLEQPNERPQGVSVKMRGKSTASVSWAPSTQSHNGSLVSVVSLTCLKPSLSQRMENTYCSEENITSDIIPSLTPGAQYRVVMYYTNGPLISPPSEPVIFDMEPTGVRDLVVYPLSPTAVILSWQRPYNVAFRKYVLQTFFFNSATQVAQWTTYYEIAATASVIASVRVTDLLPAWYYNFRVTMVTWGDPPLSCCDGSTVSFITAPEAPHISSVDYSHGVLYVRWTYGDLFTDLSHSRMLHWQVLAEGKKGSRRRFSTDVTRNVMKAALVLPPGDIYNLTVTACTERSRNTSIPHILKLDPAPPKSLYAINATHSAVTLLWTEEGVVDFYQVSCRQLKPITQLKAAEPQTAHSHVLTVNNLQASTSYNCSVISYSYSTPSEPAYITISTLAHEMNPSVAAISALAVLSVLLISLLVLFLLVLRKKHMQMTRECGAETFVNFASFERDGKLPYNCPVQLDDFEAYIKDMGKDSAYKFSLQFEELKSVGLDLSHDAADLPVNRPKNRYTNILPYDFSRVKLISMHNDEGADYINANYIPGYKSAREYIATQGPLPETRNDFWKMVMQQNSHVIVMLTQCNERRRVKCDHYWPFTDEPVSYGEITVEMLSESESPEWTIRNFRLSYADEVQDVLHFNYTSWPDHGVPTVNAIESILQFVQLVRQQVNRTKGPVTVHCSAGVGRTGTFIALDRLMQHIREHEYADILGMVSEMRSHRLSMVQTEEQYVFIHQCVLLMWKKKKQQSLTSDVIYENVTKS
ncbi:receptor-type tyrosine-protein phosphatase O isoform X3 [Tachysurus vachellii]|uniref:receptor-type tyrosine-protein phosphatase O isoform X3 n=1 Tax=Tachysurus vachellii TaxID=175792 RepID=UPI00296B1ECE|nr:receptor-type tyrosine-protein phosphatase O isoform X3 [Tachysurus vachellii]